MKRVLTIFFWSGVLFSFFSFLLPNTHAGIVTYPVETSLVLSSLGITLKVEAGSSVDSITVNGNSIVVTVTNPDAFVIRSDARYTLTNDGGLSTDCQASYSKLAIQPSVGTQTVTITPSITSCSGSTPSPTPGSSSSSTSDASSGGNSSSSPSTCTKPVSLGTPDLFEIRVNNDTAQLLFAPPNMPYSAFYISYSRFENTLEHSVQFDQGFSWGAIPYTINNLSPNTSYYFRVRAQNDCAIGGWGNSVKVTTTNSVKQYKTFYKNQLTSFLRTIQEIFPLAKQKKETNVVTPLSDIKPTVAVIPTETVIQKQPETIVFGNHRQTSNTFSNEIIVPQKVVTKSSTSLFDRITRFVFNIFSR